jgi:hypothetical protein
MAASFVILPYLRTSGPVHIRGIGFRSSSELQALPPDSRRHLETLFEMFFVRDNLRITEMTYACLEPPDDEQIRHQMHRRLHEAHTLIGYMYGERIISRIPKLGSELASMYWMWPDTVKTISAGWGLDRLENATEDSLAEDYGVSGDENVYGYFGVLNFNWTFEVVPGSRLYPPVPDLFGPGSYQDLSRDLEAFSRDFAHWAWEPLVEGEDIKVPELENRVFTALEWYNRSNQQEIEDESALVYLAIAFESLLQLEQRESLSQRFKETVMTLLGASPRLDSWLEQFYTARSKIVHEGTWPHLGFYAVERKHFRDIQRGKKTGAEYKTLVNHGQVVFQLCLNTILSGALLADRVGLPSQLVHPQERVERMCASLKRADATPVQRLLSVYEEVLSLYITYGTREHVEPEALQAAGRLIMQTYLETEPELPHRVKSLMEAAVKQDVSVTPDDSLKRLRQLARSIREWHGELPRFFVPHASDLTDAFHVVWLFVAFATWPELSTHLSPLTPQAESREDSDGT